MSRTPRRILYIVLFFLWLVVMLFPLFAVVLAAREQIQIGDNPGSHLRIFLVQEQEARGVGVEWARLSGSEGCAETRLTYLLWRGEGENTRFCSCFDAGGQSLGSYPGSCAVD